MDNPMTTEAETRRERIHFPKIFWQYYDLYRRRKITIDEFSDKTGISCKELRYFLFAILIESNTVL